MNSIIMSMRCEECGRTYKSDARFCPYDKSALVASVTPSKDTEEGMVCPKCFRGYGKEARFCPHDAEQLIPYSEWRERKERREKTI
jgi:ferredoxin